MSLVLLHSGSQVHLPHDQVTLSAHQPLLRVVSQSNVTGTTEGVYHQVPDVLLDAATVRQHVHTEPFYWRLPEQFQGDQVRVHGAALPWTVTLAQKT